MIFSDIVSYFSDKWNLPSNQPLIDDAKRLGIYLNEQDLIRIIFEEGARLKFNIESKLKFEAENTFLILRDEEVNMDGIGFPCQTPRYQYNQFHVFRSETGYIRLGYLNSCEVDYVYLFENGWFKLKESKLEKLD